MKISKLELERYIYEYQEYKKDTNARHDLNINREYLERNGLHEVLDLIEELVELETEFDKIVKILEIVEVEDSQWKYAYIVVMKLKSFVNIVKNMMG